MDSKLKRYIACGLTAASLAAGCTEEDLHSRADEGYVEIALDWGLERPAGKRFDFYPVLEDGTCGEPLTFLPDAPECNAGVEGFKGSLPSGRYRMIVASCEEGQNVEFGNPHRYESAAFHVSADDSQQAVASRAGEAAGSGNRIRSVGRLSFTHRFDEPDPDSGDYTLLTVPYQQKVKRSAAPQSCVKTVTLNIRIADPETISLDGSRGTFDGVAQSVGCVSRACSATSASVGFGIGKNSDGTALSADFRVLDLVDPAGKTSGVHTVHLTLARMNSSGTLSATIDVTGAVRELIDSETGTLPLAIPLSMELKELGDGTLSADVVSWDGEGEGAGGGTVISGSGTLE